MRFLNMTNTKSFINSKHMLCIVLVLVIFLSFAALPQIAEADIPNSSRWIVTVTNTGGLYPDNSTRPGALYTVDATTDTLYGPFLEGQLGEADGGLFDIAVTPNGRTAIVSNFVNSTVYIVDVSNPKAPTLLGSVNMSFFAEDIAITSDGKYALVADGGFSNYIASINIATRTLVEEENLTDTDAFANGITVAPDGTVICIDYFQGLLQTLTIDNSGFLTIANTYEIPQFSTEEFNFTDRPVNVAVAPDGQTVLLMTTNSPHVTVYQITSLGTLIYIGRVSGLPAIWNSDSENWWGSRQSITFSSDGKKAYVIDNGIYDPVEEGFLNNTISVLDINGPGSVTLSAASAATLLYNSTSQLFGVDVLDIAQNKLYVGNPTVPDGVSFLHVIDLNTFSVTTIPVGPSKDAIVLGVAAIPYTGTVGGYFVPFAANKTLTPLLGLATVLITFVVLLCIGVKVARARRLKSSLRGP
jgi:DNA-binding beta-propeller fold protein YncE